MINGPNIRWDNLQHMCDYGADCVKNGNAEALRFRVMPNEVEEVKSYMAETYPEIAYTINAPCFKNRLTRIPKCIIG